MVCTGDFWAASERLADLIVRLGRMIAYQEYNTKSPLNGLAAKWAAQNIYLLPIDARMVSPPPRRNESPKFPSAVPPAAAPIILADRNPCDLPDPWSEKIVIG